MTTCRGLAAVAVFWCLAGLVVAQPPVPTTIQVRPMLKITVEIKPGGAEVHGVQAGPATKMARADNPNIRGIMEKGDIITKVSGNPIRTLNDLKDGLAAGGDIIITVWDKQTKREIDWIVNPK